MTINRTSRSTTTRRAWCSKPSFTLVELLVVITIIGILAGMVLYTLAGAQRDALTARTQGTIKKINEIILYRWEEFRYRAVKVNIPDDYLSRITTGPQIGQTPVSPREGARLRLMILRDTMRMELPDQFRDIEFPPTIYQAAVFQNSGAQGYMAPPMPRSVPGEYNNFRLAFNLPPVMTPYDAAVIAGATVPAPTKNIYDSAELLYQIVAASNYNGSNGLEYFRPSEVGDVDTDGFPELIDAWGTPICFIRWPAGYGEPNRSAGAELRPYDSFLNDTTTPDALDPLKTDWRYTSTTNAQPWLLIPLIVSAGADREFNLVLDSEVNYAWTPPVGLPSNLNYPAPYFFPDPYAKSGGGFQQGQLIDTALNTDADNITNYEVLVQ